MTVAVQIRGDAQVVEYLASLPTALANIIITKWASRAKDISQYIKGSLLSGQLLGVKSGALRNSIVARVYATKSKVTLSVASRGDVPYAAIYEYGGKIPPHIIRAKNVPNLVFMGKYGQLIGVPMVNHPGSVVKARHYIQTGIDAKYQDFLTDIAGAIYDASRTVPL